MSMIIEGVTLPDIPASVLAAYPYAEIIRIIAESGEIYSLLVSECSAGHAAAGVISGVDMEILGFLSAGAAYYAAAGAAEWTFSTDIAEGKGSLPLGTVDSTTYTLIWANHDIYDITAIDTSTGEYTAGDVYFAERVEYGGYWLPKFPEDIMEAYPNCIVIRMNVVIPSETTDMLVYGICASDEPVVHVPGDISGDSNGYDEYILLPAGVGCSYEPFSGTWGAAEAAPQELFPIMDYSDGTNTISFEVLYTSKNIYTAETYEPDTFAYTLTDTVWMEGANDDSETGEDTEDLPDDETEETVSDRGIISKYIMDGIAKQIQRLTDTTEKVVANNMEDLLKTVEKPSAGAVSDGFDSEVTVVNPTYQSVSVTSEVGSGTLYAEASEGE